MLTIAPRPCSRMTAAAARVPFQVPLRCTAITSVELFFGHLPHGGVAGDAGVADHDVQAAELLDRGSHGASTSAPDVTSQRRAGDVGSSERVGRSVGPVEVEVTEDDAGAFGDELLGDGVAQSLGPPVTTAIRPASNAMVRSYFMAPRRHDVVTA